MKYLKKYENLSTAEKMVKNAFDEYDRICDLITDFIKFEKIVNFNIKYVFRYYFENDEDENGEYIVAIFDDEEPGIIIHNLEDLYRFIDNPEQYKSSKKYNL